MSSTHRPLVGIFLAFSLGVLLAQILQWPARWILTAAAGGFCIAGFFMKRPWISTLGILSAFLFLGWAYTENRQELPKNHIYFVGRYYRQQPVQLKGVIVSDVQKRYSSRGTKTVFTLEVREFKGRWNWQKKSGKILVNIFAEAEVQYGDEIIIEGKMHRPFNFSPGQKSSYQDYLARRGIRLVLSVKKDAFREVIRRGRGNPVKAASLRVKDRLKMVFTEYLSANEAGLMQAIILGDRYDIPRHIMDLFVQTGTVHILAISGMNIGMVAFLIFLLVKMLPVGRRAHYLLTIVFLIFYAFLTGSYASVVRATITAIVFMFSFLVERETEPINSLCLAGLLILVLNPLALLDIGFQLSFISVFFIVSYYSPVLNLLNARGLSDSRILEYILQSLAVSLVAWSGVAGLILYYFQIVTPVTILANLLVVPLIFLVVALGFGLLLAAMILPVAAWAFAACIKAVLNFMVGSIYLFNGLPGAYFHWKSVSAGFVAVYYVLILIVFYALLLRDRRLTK